MSVWELYIQLFARNWRSGRFAQSLSQGCSEKIRKKDVVMTAGRWSSWSIQTSQFLVTCDESWIYCWDQETEFLVKACWLSQTQEGQTQQIHPQTFDDPFFLTALAWSTCTGFPLDRQSVNKEYYVEVLRQFKKRFRQKRQALFKSGQWHFHQDNAPVHNSILVTDYLTKMDTKTVPQPSYSPDLAPCDFWLFPKLKEKLRGCCYETIERMKEAVTKVINTLTRGLPWGLPEVVGTVQQVHCSQRRLLQRGLEFHVCTINKRTHTKKSLETYRINPRVQHFSFSASFSWLGHELFSQRSPVKHISCFTNQAITSHCFV